MKCRTLCDWSRFYGDSDSEIEYYSQNSRIDSFAACSYVKNSNFMFIGASGTGGALNCNSECKLLIEETSFYGCASNKQGGAIYASSIAHCILNRVCGFGCHSVSANDQFCSISISWVKTTNKNEIHESSICNSIALPKSSYTIEFFNGCIVMEKMNESNNECYSHSGLSVSPSLNGDIVASYISYSSISNNTMISSICISFFTKCC